MSGAPFNWCKSLTNCLVDGFNLCQSASSCLFSIFKSKLVVTQFSKIIFIIVITILWEWIWPMPIIMMKSSRRLRLKFASFLVIMIITRININQRINPSFYMFLHLRSIFTSIFPLSIIPGILSEYRIATWWNLPSGLANFAPWSSPLQSLMIFLPCEWMFYTFISFVIFHHLLFHFQLWSFIFIVSFVFFHLKKLTEYTCIRLSVHFVCCFFILHSLSFVFFKLCNCFICVLLS